YQTDRAVFPNTATYKTYLSNLRQYNSSLAHQQYQQAVTAYLASPALAKYQSAMASYQKAMTQYSVALTQFTQTPAGMAYQQQLAASARNHTPAPPTPLGFPAPPAAPVLPAPPNEPPGKPALPQFTETPPALPALQSPTTPTFADAPASAT